MKVKLKAKYSTDHLGNPIVNRYVDVRTLKQASVVVRNFIELHDLTAGCNSESNAFTGGEILEDGEKIARVSYNGRVWDLAQQEIKL